MNVFKYALNNGADWIFQTDSDGQTSPSEFSGFWNSRNDYPIVIGIRNKRGDGLSRIFVTRILRLFLLITMHVWVKDANTSFRLMEAKTLKNYIKLIPEGFFLSNVLLSAIFVKNKEKCKWIPISFRKREKGVNSINIPRIIKIGFKAVEEFRLAKKNLS